MWRKMNNIRKKNEKINLMDFTVYYTLITVVTVNYKIQNGIFPN